MLLLIVLFSSILGQIVFKNKPFVIGLISMIFILVTIFHRYLVIYSILNILICILGTYIADIILDIINKPTKSH